MKITLVGFMGTGKSEVAKLLARKLNYEYIDTDNEIKKKVDMEIPEIFKIFGEDHFRHLETKELDKILDSYGNFVVATGGGIVLSRHNITIIKEKSLPILLKASPEIIYERIKDSHRPLLQVANPFDRIQELLKERSQFYNSFNLQVDTDYKKPEEIIKEITGLIYRVKSCSDEEGSNGAPKNSN